MGLKVFVDSDVVISSVISSSGAAFTLLNERPQIIKTISNYSRKEILVVSERLSLSKPVVKKRLNCCEQVSLDISVEELKRQYKSLVNDIEDAHVVAGALKAKVNFLISYNLRDYKLDLIRKKRDIVCLKPGDFLQLLRNK